LRALGAARGWLALNTRQGPWAAWLWAGGLVLTLRLVLGLSMAGAWWLLRPHLPLAPAASAGGWLAEGLVGVWERWDAVHYLALATVGYEGVSVGDTVFYPLYPLVVRGVARLLGGHVGGAALAISTVAAVTALAGLYRLSERRYGPVAAQWAVSVLAAYPTALFLIAPFTEATFLALTVWAFVCAEDERWPLAGVLAVLAALTRGPGLLTVPALAWLAWRQWQRQPVGRRWSFAVRVGLSLALAAAGGGAFLVYRAAQGWPPVNAVLRAYSGVELLDPIRGTYHALVQAATQLDLPAALDLASATLFGGLLVAMLVRPRWRVGAWLIYFGSNLVFDLSKHSLTAAAWQSLARYVLVLFPAFIVLGDWLAHQGRRSRFVYLTVSSAGLLVLSMLFALWFFIG
jgi:hypothetical protein